MLELTPAQVRALRLRRQRLHARAPAGRLADVAAEIGGVHAQVMSAGELQLWARVEGISAGDVRAALWERRELVKTWAMRGTLHLLPAAEWPLWTAALSTRQDWRREAWQRAFGLAGAEMEALIAALGARLEGTGATREEIADAASAAVGPHVRERLLHGWGSYLKPAAFAGVLVFAPNRGRNVTFAHPREWLGPWEPREPGEALLAVARRFLRAFGPATHEDFARWWGGASASARRLLAALGEEVVPVLAEGRPAWLLREDAAEAAELEPVRSTRLVPHFDPYVLHYRPREAFVAPQRADEIFRTAGWVTPVVLVDGRLGGTWELVRRGRRAEVRIDPWVRLARDRRRELGREAASLADFLGTPVQLVG